MLDKCVSVATWKTGNETNYLTITVFYLGKNDIELNCDYFK